MNKTEALILIGHGSRLERTAREMQDLVEEISSQTGSETSVVGAFMELQKPTLKDQVVKLSDAGVRNVRVLPLFIFNGRHMLEDIPAQVRDCEKEFPQISFTLLPHIGQTDAFRLSILASI